MSVKTLKAKTGDFIRDNCVQEHKEVIYDGGKEYCDYTLTKLKPDADTKMFFKLYHRWGKLLKKHLNDRKAEVIRREIVKLVTILKD